MNHDQAYLLGLLVGGGAIGSNTFTVTFPFKKWGTNPRRMNQIANDFLDPNKPVMKSFRSYGVVPNYKIQNNEWVLELNTAASSNIKNSINQIVKDLQLYGLPTSGVLLNQADLVTCKSKFKALEAEKFLAGIFDTRASLTKSHRRFSNNYPIVSIEVPGSSGNFEFVFQLCCWMTDLGSVTDQILYNHPCQHSSWDADYSSWRKGFKIRFLVKSFIAKHSFAMMAKAFNVSSLQSSQTGVQQFPCANRSLGPLKPLSIHKDINDPSLPTQVKGKLFFHHLHICAAMGCPHAPSGAVQASVSTCSSFIATDSIRHKEENWKDCTKYFFKNYLTANNRPIRKTMSAANFLEQYKGNYPGAEDGIAFLFASALKGKRTVGKRVLIISSSKTANIDVWEIVVKGNSQINTVGSGPIVIVNMNNRRGVFLSPVGTPNINSKIQISGIDVNVL